MSTLLKAPTRAATITRTDAPIRVSVKNLSGWYGGKLALDDISLDIADRKITALIGPSGCGKSTFLRCLNRLNDTVGCFRSEGSIMLGSTPTMGRGIDIVSLRRTVGMVFQQPNPFPMSIFDNIALAIKEHEPRIRKQELEDRVVQSLRHANLFDEIADVFKKQSALALSGGQQQRLCIARALAVRPSVLLLDEPCASLDPISTARIEELLLELKRDYTIVIVTHNLPQAARIADDTAFFLLGKLVEAGPTAQLASSPARPETADYFAGAFG